MNPTHTILVIEDNPLTRKMLRITLESEGYGVIEAEDGRTGLAAAGRCMPSLVLQDLVLPDVNGFELVQQLRALTGGLETPILALSGFLHGMDQARSVEVGFTAMLLKPIEPTGLLEVVRAYLPKERQTDLSGGGRLVLVVDDDAVQAKLTRLLLLHMSFQVITVGSGAEALALLRSEPVDVVLSDVLMPDVDGFQLCSEIRSDPQLARLPVVLTSAWYRAASDTDLAIRVGANALLERTPELHGVGRALLQALTDGAPKSTPKPSTELKLEHAAAVIRQLERQLRVSTDLTRRCSLQAAQISLLGGIADALAHSDSPEAALKSVLAATLDAAGISKGILYLADEARKLKLRHAIGFAATDNLSLSTFFDHLELLQDVVLHQATMSVPSATLSEEIGASLLACADAVSIQVVPLVAEGRGVGAMVLAAKHADVTSEDSIAFARAMGNQLAQSIELASSIARLIASERRYRTVTEAARDAISILTPDGVILEANPSFEATLGLPRQSIVGRSVTEFSAGGLDQENIESFRKKLGSGAGDDLPLSLQRPDGSVTLMEFSVKNVDLAEEQLVVAIGRDVTERVNTQAHLMFSDRMASIGALAAGVAHEINNPLTATTVTLELMQELLSDSGRSIGKAELSDLRQMLSEAGEAAERVRTIVRDLMLFSRAEEDKRGAVDVKRALESSLRMASNEIRHRARLIREYQDVPFVEANESRLGQVFLNLLVNAAQALPDGLANVNEIRVRTRLAPTGRVEVDIEDTGPGIPPEILARLFTPFFTTKPRGVGTGLGLSICRRILASFGGEITVNSELGRGTLVRVSMPPSASEPARLSSAPPEPKSAHRGRVLVVDDDPHSAAVVARVLADEHEVTVANSSAQALARITAGESFHVILCDMMMPVQTGVEFYQELSMVSPEHLARIIFVTGGAFTVKAREFLDRVSNPRLEKPFQIRELRQLVSERVHPSVSAPGVTARAHGNS
jgi:PAS domain S-box-containing protein